jgi:hypothetical protein
MPSENAKVVATILLNTGKIQLLRCKSKEGPYLKYVWTCSGGADCFKEDWPTDQGKKRFLESVNHQIIGRWEAHVSEKHWTNVDRLAPRL